MMLLRGLYAAGELIVIHIITVNHLPDNTKLCEYIANRNTLEIRTEIIQILRIFPSQYTLNNKKHTQNIVIY